MYKRDVHKRKARSQRKYGQRTRVQGKHGQRP